MSDHPCDIANLPECMGIPCEGYRALLARAEAAEAACDRVSANRDALVEDLDALSARLAEVEAERDRLRRALEELVVLMEAVRSGDYVPDSFTTQPARFALSPTVAQEVGDADS